MEIINEVVSWFFYMVDIVLHLDQHLNEWVSYFGPSIYIVLFLIVFSETGLVVTPFLPGDSLLFALGALAAVDGAFLNVYLMWVLLLIAGILGDAVNYAIGARVGPKVFFSESSKIFNKAYLLKTQAFYERYGGKTIIFARFVPIVRTFAPFVAGIGNMSYRAFAIYNVIGAFLWVTSFLFAGFYFGNLEVIKRNFHIVIFAIILISILPGGIEWWRSKRSKN